MAEREHGEDESSWTVLYSVSDSELYQDPDGSDTQMQHSMNDINSSDLFGFGDTSDETLNSGALFTLKLKYTMASSSSEVEIRLQTSEAVVVKYAACMPTGSPTLLETKLCDRFGHVTQVDVSVDNVTVHLEAIADDTGIQENLRSVIMALSDELTVKRIDIDEDKYHYAIKHLNHCFHTHAVIKFYIVEQSNSVAFVVPRENVVDSQLLDEHIKVVKDCDIVTCVKNLSVKDRFKLKSSLDEIPVKGTDIQLGDNDVTVKGFSEDVQEVMLGITVKLQAYVCETRKLDPVTVGLLNDASYAECVNTVIQWKNWKLVWQVVGDEVFITGRSGQYVSSAADLIEGHMVTINSESDIGLVRLLWKRSRELAQADRGSGSGNVTVIKTKISLIDKIQDAVCNSETTLIVVPEHRRFILNEIIDNFSDLAFNTARSDETFMLKGSEQSIAVLEQRLKNVHVMNLWITDERYVTILQGLRRFHNYVEVGCGVKIEIVSGKIENEQTDVIVNSAGPNLGSGDAGTITRSISNAVGFLPRSHATPVKTGDVINGKPGNLACKMVLHAVLAKYNVERKDENISQLKEVVDMCLSKTVANGNRSIAFPALCTGVLQHPPDIVAEAMLDAIMNFVNGHQRELDNIRIVCLQDDKKEAFVRCVSRRQMEADAAKGCLVQELPWPKSYCCSVVAETETRVQELVRELKDILREQTLPMRTFV